MAGFDIEFIREGGKARMLFERKASEIPQFVVVLAIAVVLGAVAIWAILSNVGAQGTSVAGWINSIAVPVAHP